VAEVDASTRRRAEYSTDASLYRVPPELVVFPRDADEVVAVVETYAGLVAERPWRQRRFSCWPSP
jgi:hypothetical protein